MSKLPKQKLRKLRKKKRLSVNKRHVVQKTIPIMSLSQTTHLLMLKQTQTVKQPPTPKTALAKL